MHGETVKFDEGFVLRKDQSQDLQNIR